MGERRPDVLVVGAGVIGLTTAVCLAEAGADVTVWTAQPPRRTTSAVAGAMCGPTITGPQDPATRWAEGSDKEFRALAETPSTGVHLVRGRLVSKWGDAPPPWAPTVPGFAPCTPTDVPPGFRVSFWAELPFADMPRYLEHLQTRLAAAGGRLELRTVSDLAEAAASAPVIVNATGTGARELVPDHSVRAVKGQHVIVENPGLDTFLYEGGAATAWTGIFPHGDHVVLGGVAVQDDWDRTSDPATSEAILARAAAVEPRLAGARVLGVEVGLRPARPSVRLAEEAIGASRCIHSYGHGSVGVTLSWGCAHDVVAMINGPTDAQSGAPWPDGWTGSSKSTPGPGSRLPWSTSTPTTRATTSRP